MVRKIFIALTLTMILALNGAISAFAAQAQAPSAAASCTPVVTIAGSGWGWETGSDHVNMGVGYIASCAATATLTFRAVSPDGKTVWTQRYHQYVLSTVGETVNADWRVRPQLPPGDYTISFEITNTNGQTTFTTYVMGSITLPLG